MKRTLVILTGIALLLAFQFSSVVVAQDTPRPRLQCGDIVEGEVTTGQSAEFYRLSTDRRGDEYQLNVQAGTRINLTITPLGSTFNVAYALLDEAGNDVLNANRVPDGEAESLLDMQLGSSNQVLRVMGAKPGKLYESNDTDLNEIYRGDLTFHSAAGLYFGAYEIRLGCTLRDGTVIEPGDALAPPKDQPPPMPVVPERGFPGLAPVDFASAFRLPLTLATPMEGEIPASGTAVLGFRFDANAGDTVDLSFERISGNLNLGLVVLSADNQVAYMAALVSSQTMNSRFTLPSTGEYTIGVFRIDLITPDTPEATGFIITAALNP